MANATLDFKNTKYVTNKIRKLEEALDKASEILAYHSDMCLTVDNYNDNKQAAWKKYLLGDDVE